MSYKVIIKKKKKHTSSALFYRITNENQPSSTDILIIILLISTLIIIWVPLLCVSFDCCDIYSCVSYIINLLLPTARHFVCFSVLICHNDWHKIRFLHVFIAFSTNWTLSMSLLPVMIIKIVVLFYVHSQQFCFDEIFLHFMTLLLSIYKFSP